MMTEAKRQAQARTKAAWIKAGGIYRSIMLSEETDRRLSALMIHYKTSRGAVLNALLEG